MGYTFLRLSNDSSISTSNLTSNDDTSSVFFHPSRREQWRAMLFFKTTGRSFSSSARTDALPGRDFARGEKKSETTQHRTHERECSVAFAVSPQAVLAIRGRKTHHINSKDNNKEKKKVGWYSQPTPLNSVTINHRYKSVLQRFHRLRILCLASVHTFQKAFIGASSASRGTSFDPESSLNLPLCHACENHS